jgi:hypothetical protein
MKKYYLISCILILTFIGTLNAQTKLYRTSGGEFIFSWGELQLTESYKQANPGVSISDEPLRFTCFLHLGHFVHLDLNNILGVYTGVGLRNVGMISNEILPDPVNGGTFKSKIIRRTYSVGVPVAVKIGSFKDNFNIYAGGEYECAFHMKEKYWDQHHRSSTKVKRTGWMPEQITRFLPSAFVGVQFPKGINVKFKYYLENFLNHDYTISENEIRDVVSNVSRYETSQLMYISLSWHFSKKKKVKKSDANDESVGI